MNKLGPQGNLFTGGLVGLFIFFNFTLVFEKQNLCYALDNMELKE